MSRKPVDTAHEVQRAAARRTKLANTFSAVLREWLTPEELLEATTLNRTETDKGVCHSHDFCDANMAMLEAFQRAFQLVDEDAAMAMSETDEGRRLWGSAWDLAIQHEFKEIK